MINSLYKIRVELTIADCISRLVISGYFSASQRVTAIDLRLMTDRYL